MAWKRAALSILFGLLLAACASPPPPPPPAPPPPAPPPQPVTVDATVRLTIDEQGRVADVTVVEVAPDDSHNAELMAAIRAELEFAPAIIDGKPTAATLWRRVTYTTIEKKLEHRVYVGGGGEAEGAGEPAADGDESAAPSVDGGASAPPAEGADAPALQPTAE